MTMLRSAPWHALFSAVVDIAPHGRRPRDVIVAAVVFTAFAFVRGGELVDAPGALTADGHAIASINAAMNERFCGRYAVVSDRFQIGYRVATTPQLSSTPLRSVIDATAGSIPTYCATLTSPYANNENSLTEAMSWALALNTDASAHEINRALWRQRLIIVVVGATALFAVGGSAALSLIVIEAGVALLYELRGFASTLYGFLFLMPLLGVSVYTFAFWSKPTRVRSIAGWFAVAGVISALGGNMRTSHIPVYAVLGVLALVYVARTTNWRTAVVAALTMAVACVGANQWLATRRTPSPAQSAGTYTHHVVGHPLVLSLALPPSDLSRREGIKWDDSVGATLAARQESIARYLGAGYENALFGYYWSLWRRYPGEMVGVYLRKFAMVNDGMLETLGGRSALFHLLRPWAIASDGYVRLWITCVVAIASLLIFRRWSISLAAIVLLLTVTALLMHLEAGLTVPSFVPKYHGFTVFWCVLMVAVTIQAAGAILARRFPARSSVPPSWQRWTSRALGAHSYSRRRLADVALRRVRSWSTSPRWLHAAIVAGSLLFAGLAGWLRPTVGVDALLGDQHAVVSMTHALDRVICGRGRQVHYSFGLRNLRPGAATVPIRHYIDEVSNGAPCLDTPRTYINNENGVGLLMQAGAILNPDASIEWLGKWLYVVRVAMVASAGFALVALRFGAPIALLVIATTRLVSAPLEQTHPYSIYPLLLPSLLCNMAFWAVTYQYWRTWRVSRWWLVLLGGALVGFASQIRTSHTPILFGLGLVCGALTLLGHHRRGTGAMGVRVSATTWFVALSAGYLTVSLTVIALLTPPTTLETQNSIHHPIAHPVVLGLGVPPTQFAIREGIRWDDTTGMTLARRIDPEARYLGRGYSEALLRYYVQLWRNHPREMFEVYWLKSAVAGQELVRGLQVVAADALPLRTPLRALPLSSGHLIGLSWVVLFGCACHRALRTGGVRAMSLALLTFALVCFHVEGTLILPMFNLTIHTAYAGVAFFVLIALLIWTARATAFMVLKRTATLRGFALQTACVAFWSALAVIVIALIRMNETTGGPAAAFTALLVGAITILSVTLRLLARMQAAMTILWCGALSAVVASAAPARYLAPAKPASAIEVPVGAIRQELLRDVRLTWNMRADGVVQASGGDFAVAAAAHAQFSYLLVSDPIELDAADALVASGVLTEGGFTCGLQQGDAWKTYSNVIRPGPFTIALNVPASGVYTIVVANAVQRAGETNRFTLDSFALADRVPQ